MRGAAMILTTVYLAAAESSTDPWHVLGSTYDERLAIAALAELTLARRVRVTPTSDAESPAARRLELVAGGRPGGVLGTAFDALASSNKQLDIDRAVRLLRDLAPIVEAELIASGDLVEAGQKGLLKKRTVLAVRPESRASAQSRLRASGNPASAAHRALVLIATTGLSAKHLAQLCGGPIAATHDPFDEFEPASLGTDGQPLGENAADLLTALVTVLAATGDTSAGHGDR